MSSEPVQPRVIDLAGAAKALTEVLAGLGPDDLGRPTPCSEFTVADLLDHLLGAVESLVAAVGNQAAHSPTEPRPDNAVPRLRSSITRLVDVWRDPRPHQQHDSTSGGDTTTAAFANRIALQELLIHAWDLATATGQRLDVDQRSVNDLLRFLLEHEDDDVRDGEGRRAFSDTVRVGHDAPALNQALGLSGRDPSWHPPGNR